jgi:hypothetical protein
MPSLVVRVYGAGRRAVSVKQLIRRVDCLEAIFACGAGRTMPYGSEKAH